MGVRLYVMATVLLLGCFVNEPAAQDANPSPKRGLNGIEEIPFDKLTDRNVSIQGQRALAIDPDQWKHGETDHFIIHFAQSYIATPVAVEAEFYYRVVTEDLDVTPPPNAGKNHIFIFESAEDWGKFVQAAELEPWTGAVKIGGELFVPRNPKIRFKGNALGHEIAHLMVHRFLGTQLPLWLEEGYAEDVSLRGYAAFYRARGYSARPAALEVPGYIPLKYLTAFKSYPPQPYVISFYRQSRRLAGFLNSFGNKQKFVKMLTSMANGKPFDSALQEAYGARWFSVDAMEADFKKYLEKP